MKTKIALAKIKTSILVLLALVAVSVPFTAVKAQSDINLTGYTLTFADEFNSLSVTTSSPKGASTWFYWPPYGASGGYSASNWNVNAFSVSGGILTDLCWWDTPSSTWQSGNLSSMDPTAAGFAQQYGYFEIRCQMPSAGTGAWPAFWLNTRNGIPAVGQNTNNEEIDIFEWYGNTYTTPQTVIQEASHNWKINNGGNDSTAPYVYSPATPMPGGAFPWQGYHIYGCQVDPVHLTWYIDGVQTNQCATPTSYMSSPFYVMVDYALGGGWPLSGTPFPTHGNSSLLVDWVRVYSLPSAPSNNVVSYQFDAFGSTYGIASTASAGVVPAAHWNVNINAAASGTFSGLVDSTGASTTIAGSYSSKYSDYNYTASRGYGLPTSPNQSLFTSFVAEDYWSGGGTGTLSLTNIPYSNYDLIVYLQGSSGQTSSLNVTLSGGPTYTNTIPNNADTLASPVVFTQITASGQLGNYVRYTGLTGSTKTFTFSNSGSGSGTGISGFQIVPATSGSGTNLALNKPATASSIQSSGVAASYAVDGSLSTRWGSAFSDPQWIYVDLGATHSITEVKLTWETAYGKAYQIQVSNDASTWTTIYSTTTGDGGVDDLTGLSGSGRYVRMYGTVRGTGYGYSLWEFAVYGN